MRGVNGYGLMAVENDTTCWKTAGGAGLRGVGLRGPLDGLNRDT